MRKSAPSPTSTNIGDRLRVARLDRHLSLEESAWRTRIRPDLLRAMEDDRYDDLGHESFIRSHLTSYARFLGIDAVELMEVFDASRGTPPSAIGELDRAARSARKPQRARWLLASGLSLIVLIGAAVGGILGGQAERPPGGDGATVPMGAGDTSLERGPLTAAEVRVRLRVEAAADTHVSVIVDGAEVFEGILAAGQARVFRAADHVDLIASDGGTISLTLNGEDLGSAGTAGAVYRARFGPDGVADPSG